jgi:N-acetylglutamate synthase-like GNAT family acetyltransferase
VPFALVAEHEGAVCGTALVIDSDLAERPEITPWLAALWVDEAMRRCGVAASLLEEGCRRSQVLGIDRLHLCSRAPLQGFYTRLGWTIVEENVGPHAQTVYVRTLGLA